MQRPNYIQIKCDEEEKRFRFSPQESTRPPTDVLLKWRTRSTNESFHVQIIVVSHVHRARELNSTDRASHSAWKAHPLAAM